MGLSIVRKDMILNEVEIWRYSNFKIKPYENSKLKFIWETQNTPKYMGRDFTKTVDRTSLQIHLDLKTLPSIGQWCYFRTRGPGSRRTFELHYLAIIRQVHQTQVYEPKFILAHVRRIILKPKFELHYIIAFKSKIVFYKWWTMESWSVLHDRRIVWWRFHCTGNDE